MALLRRVAALSEMQLRRPLAVDFAALAAAAQRIETRNELHWRDWTRRSARQQQAMTVGGAVGRLTLHGDDTDLRVWWLLLHLGQWLHVGKLASFGLGGYRLLPALADRIEGAPLRAARVRMAASTTAAR